MSETCVLLLPKGASTLLGKHCYQITKDNRMTSKRQKAQETDMATDSATISVSLALTLLPNHHGKQNKLVW